MEDNVTQETWKIKKTIQHTTHVKHAKYNKLSNQILILDQEKIELHSLDNEKQPITLPHSSCLWKPSFDPAGRYLVTNPNKEIITLSNTDGKKITTIDNSEKDAQNIVIFSPQADQILIASGGYAQLKNLDGILITHCKPKYSVKIAKFFSCNEHLIFLAPYSSYAANPKAKLWDIRNKSLITYDYIEPLSQASIDPNGSYVAGIRCSDNGVAYVYDLRKSGYTHLSNFNKPKSAKFNTTGTHILTQYYSAFLALLWNIQITKCIGTSKYPEFGSKITSPNLYSAKFHPEGNHMLTCSSTTFEKYINDIAIWNLAGNQLAKLSHDKKLYSAKYDQTGNYIISRHENNIVTLWKKSE